MINLAAILGAGPVEPPAAQPDQRRASKELSFDAHLNESLSSSTVSQEEAEETESVDFAILLGVQQEFSDWIATKGPRTTSPDLAATPLPEIPAVPAEMTAAAPVATVPDGTAVSIEPGADPKESVSEEITKTVDGAANSAASPASIAHEFFEAPVPQEGATADVVPRDSALRAPELSARATAAGEVKEAPGVATDLVRANHDGQSPAISRRTAPQTGVATDRTDELSSAIQDMDAERVEALPRVVARTIEQPSSQNPLAGSTTPQNPPDVHRPQNASVSPSTAETPRDATSPQKSPVQLSRNQEEGRRATERFEGRPHPAAAPNLAGLPDNPASNVQAPAPGARRAEPFAAAGVASSTPVVVSIKSGTFEASTDRGGDDRSFPDSHIPGPTLEIPVQTVKAVSAEQTVPSSAPHSTREAAAHELVPRLIVHTPLVTQPVGVATEAAAAATTEVPRGSLPPETADPIIQSLRMQYQLGGGDAVVHIKPEHLGPVSVSLRVENGVVSAVVNADNPAVVEWLKANEHLLRDGLASSGLHLERFAVRRDGPPPDDRGRHWRPPEEQERRRRALQPESTFEITV